MNKKIRTTLLFSLGMFLSACTTTSGSNSTSQSSSHNDTNTNIVDESSNTTSLTSIETSTENATSSNESEIVSSFSSPSEASLSSSQLTSSDSSNISSLSSDSSTTSVEPVVDAKITTQGVYAEGAYGEWEDANASEAKVAYKLSTDSSYTEIDTELVRQKNSTTARFDVLGLKAGIYDFKITTSSKEELSMSNITITAYDRSGYAHFNASSGVGAYNDDGTLKSNAQIIYVNEETKNTVKASIGGKSYTGICAILANASNSSNPLVVRILGQISAATWDPISYTKGSDNLIADQIVDKNGDPLPTTSATLNEEDIINGGYNTLNTTTYSKLNGLSNKIKYSNGEFDSAYNMLNISEAKNVTLEGVGDDAILFQWGITWKNCSYIEVRNLTFDDYPEDACAVEGNEDSTTISGFKSGHVWIHNNQFNEGKNYWDVCPEQDKHEGDGATDLKKLAFVTLSYNHYVKNHKTGLVGGSDSQHTASITYHHNFYDQCSSRLPLGRQANMHMYNNYYYKSSSYSMSIRAGAYAFVENCYFEGGKTPYETKDGASLSGAVKAYNNTFTNVNGSNNVTSRTESVTNDNIYDKNFDTSTTNFYYDSTNKVSDVEYLSSAEQAKIDTKAYAGPAHINVTSSSSSSGNSGTQTPDPTPEPTGDSEVLNAATLTSGTYTSNLTSGIFTINATSEKTIEISTEVNTFSSFDSSYTGEIKLGGAGTSSYRSVSFTISKAAQINIYARSSNSSDARSLAIYNDAGELVNQFDAITSATELTYSLAAGSYYIASTNKGMNIGAVVLQYNS